MRPARFFMLLFLPLGACATLPPTPATPYLPPSTFGVYQDNAVGAINYSSWAFASAANTRGNPLAAMRAVIAMEYLPGELQENPRWVKIDSLETARMAKARAEVRQVLGIQPDVPPQLVVNTLLWASNALMAGDRAGALKALSAPWFTLGPEQTLAMFTNLPYVHDANFATSWVEAISSVSGGNQ